jgi:hypothetical protein
VVRCKHIGNHAGRGNSYTNDDDSSAYDQTDGHPTGL